MKSLSLSRPLIIMMVGVPGAGKSYFARQFSDMFCAPLVSFDRLRYELGGDDLQFSKENDRIISNVIFSQIEELTKTNKTFIVDGGMSTRICRARIEQIIKDKEYKTLIIWVQTDPQTTKSRSLRRNPKREYDMYNTSLSPEEYEKLSKKVSPPSPRESYIVISGKHTFSTQAKTVLRKLVSFREETEPLVVQPAPQRVSPQPMRHSVTIQ